MEELEANDRQNGHERSRRRNQIKKRPHRCIALGAPDVQAKGRCVCPQIYAPVVCDKGKTFPNQCVADCRRAKNCVPADLF